MNPRNAIFVNNLSRYDILGVFGMQIEFSKIFANLSKKPLMEVVVTGRPAATTAADDGQ